MPLRLNLRPYEQIMINGAVITNIRRRSFLAIHNHARIIPGKFILKEENAVTPVRRIYFAVQMAYIFCEDIEQLNEWSDEFDRRLQEVLGVLSNDDMRSRLAETAEAFGARQFYKALRLLQDVMEYEDKLFAVGGTPPPPAFGDGLNLPPGEAGKAGRGEDRDGRD
jgi:flagellar protein FlbT